MRREVSKLDAAKKQERMEALDLLKGLGIILVLIAHTDAAPGFYRIFSTFYMSLFFWGSGFLHQREARFRDLLYKKSKTLFSYYIVGGGIYLLLDLHRFGFIPSLILRELEGLFLFPTTDKMPSYGGALWFIPCLFCVELLIFIIDRVTEKYQSVLVAGLSLLGIGLSQYFNGQSLRLIWAIDTALVAVGIYFIGMCCRKWGFIQICAKIRWFWIVGIFLYLWHFAVQNPISMWANIYSDPFLFWHNAVIGSILSFTIVLKLSNSKRGKILKSVMAYAGRNSIVIYITHPFIIWAYTYGFKETVPNQLANFTGFVITFILCICIVQLKTIISKLQF